MGIKLIMFYINSISATIIEDNCKKNFCYTNEQIDERLFNSLKVSLDDGKLSRLEMSNTETDLSMSIFCENVLSHFGIVDLYNDINYYYDDGTKDSNLIPINGQVFEKWMVCRDNELLWEAVLLFAHNGERSLNVDWAEE